MLLAGGSGLVKGVLYLPTLRVEFGQFFGRFDGGIQQGSDKTIVVITIYGVVYENRLWGFLPPRSVPEIGLMEAIQEPSASICS